MTIFIIILPSKERQILSKITHRVLFSKGLFKKMSTVFKQNVFNFLRDFV